MFRSYYSWYKMRLNNWDCDSAQVNVLEIN